MLNKDYPLRIARFLDAQKGLEPVILDISQQSGFADYFIIVTVTSIGHLRGLLRNLDDELSAIGIHTKSTKRSVTEDEQWVLVDCGDFIIHLMTKPAREFYALEKLWFESPHVELASGQLVDHV